MNLEKIETKEPLIKDFFTWLLKDERIIDNDVTLEKQIDLALVPYYRDANIYYPKQIANFFNTRPMKRLGRISQLNLVIDEFPNTYHTRLDHSKGVYYRKLEEMLYNFQNPLWKKNIEEKNMKLHLLAELIKIAGHDIGHFPLSHAFEQVIYSHHGPHEIFGKRIMLEDIEIQSVLKSISPALPCILEELYENNVLNFQEHDESNYDVDRIDYLYRDNLFAGTPFFIPYFHYETVPIIIEDDEKPKTSSDGSIVTSSDSDQTIDVYDYTSLHSVEQFLEIREKSYKNMYFSPSVHVRENTINTLFKCISDTNSNSGKDLRNFICTLYSNDINNVDLRIFLEWDDIKLYSEILDIAQNHEEPNLRLLAAMTLPNLKSFLNLLHYELNINGEKQNYSEQDKTFLQNIKTIITSQNEISQNIKNPGFAMTNTFIYPTDKTLPENYISLLAEGLIHSTNLKIKAYNPKEPIYIRSSDGKIYDLSHHPDRKYDWDKKITYIKNIYAYIPFLRFKGISDEQIEEMRIFCNSTAKQTDTSQKCHNVFMKPSQSSKYLEYDFLDL